MDTEDDNGPIGLVFGEEEAEQEAESVSLSDQLECFRQQWREELYTRKRRDSTSSDRAHLEEQAKECFMTGSRLEQQGSLYEAVQFYRHAMKMVPDIENLIQLDFNGKKQNSPRERQTSESSLDSYDGEVDIDTQLTYRFQDLQLEQEGWCCKIYEQRACHISSLPSEVMIYILKWVVSSQIDMKTLEKVATVCRGFYLLTRDEELWRLACYRIWSSNTGKVKKYGSWRNMYIERPHLEFTGCYISKVTYHRRGERNMYQIYDPWHTVVYYRYVRFFSDGKVVMMTSSDEPEVTVSSLRNPDYEPMGMLKGVYKLSGNTVTCVLKRVKTNDNSNTRFKRSKNKQNSDKTTMTFHMSFPAYQTNTSLFFLYCIVYVAGLIRMWKYALLLRDQGLN